MASYLFLNITFPSGIGIGASRAAILEGIEVFGSISGAARAVGLSYRGAWVAVQELNKKFPQPLVEMRVGGPASGAALTPFGKKVVAHFRAIEHQANVAIKSRARAFERFLGEDVSKPADIPVWARSPKAPAGEKKKPAKPKPAKIR